MGLELTPYRIDDFSGGITDHFINGALNRGERCDNLYILQNKSIMTRGGSEIDDATNYAIPSGQQRISGLLNYNNSEKLFVQSAQKIWYRNPSAYTELVGPVTSNPVFNIGTTANFISSAEWNRHLFVSNDAFSYVSKIYKDGAGVYQVRTAGLPYLATSPTVTQGALTKTGDTNTNITLTNMSSVTGIEIGQTVTGVNIPAGTTVAGVGTTTVTLSQAATGSTAGSTFTFGGTRSYVYVFHYYFTYTIGTQIFEDYGGTTEVEKTGFVDPSVVTAAIASIPALANGANTNYDTATIKVYIYRTVKNQTTPYKIGEVTNGTTTFNDTFADATSGLVAYTTGGVLDNDAPPLCKYVHVTNNIGYYFHIKIGSEVFPNKYRISLPFDIDSSPADFEDEVEDEITGGSSVQSIPIIFCRRHVYRSEGFFDEFGRGSLGHVRISDTAGNVSNNSAVQAENGLFWCGNDGVYYTDGYKVLKITDHLNETYRNMLDECDNPANIVGTFDERNRRILWASQSDSGSNDNDFCLVLELRWGISSESTFTTISGGTSFAPTYLTFFDGTLYRADKRGYVFKHTEGLLNDPKVDTALAASAWVKQTIIHDYKGLVSNFGRTDVRKWVPRMFITAKNRSNVSIQIYALNDDKTTVRELKQIRWRGNFVWGDPEFVWGDDCLWNAEGLIEEWRHLPAGGIRVSYMQIQITNAHTVITNSNTLGTATFDSTAKTATLDAAATVDWPENSVDYVIATEDDSYVREFTVTARAADVLTFADLSNLSSSGSKEWVLRGLRKDEILNLLSYTMLAASISRSSKTYETGDSGENS